MALNSVTWSAVVKKKFLQSTAFKALDVAVDAYLKDKSKLPQLKSAWSEWTKKLTTNGKSYKDSDRYVAGGALDDIAQLVAPVTGPVGIGSLASMAISKGGGGLTHVRPNAVRPPPPINTGLTVAPTGWTYVAYDNANANHNWAGPVTGVAKPLTHAETARINESLRRSKAAVELARDTLIKLPRDPSLWKGTKEENAYTDFFGAFDEVRYQLVLENYRALVLAFDGQPNVVDIRNTTAGGNCYAACVRRNLKTKVNGSMALSGRVDIFLGQAFLGGGGGALAGRYESGTDATVGTLIHEFAHGAINAVDAPMVNPAGTAWTLTPNLTVGAADYGISPDPWNNQASTPEDDRNLARFDASVAVRSADNYGQFARAILMLKSQ
jgi:hypothetical protein